VPVSQGTRARSQQTRLHLSLHKAVGSAAGAVWSLLRRR